MTRTANDGEQAYFKELFGAHNNILELADNI